MLRVEVTPEENARQEALTPTVEDKVEAVKLAEKEVAYAEIAQKFNSRSQTVKHVMTKMNKRVLNKRVKTTGSAACEGGKSFRPPLYIEVRAVPLSAHRRWRAEQRSTACTRWHSTIYGSVQSLLRCL